jgi:hypothetical protein
LLVGRDGGQETKSIYSFLFVAEVDYEACAGEEEEDCCFPGEGAGGLFSSVCFVFVVGDGVEVFGRRRRRRC